MKLLVLFCLLGATPTPADAQGKFAAKLVRALRDQRFKVRLQAAILAGKKKVRAAIKPLRGLLTDEHAAVRAAAALSLGRLGDEPSRAGLVRLLGEDNSLVVRSAEKALGELDRARGRPLYLVAVAKPAGPASEQQVLHRLGSLLQAHLAKTAGLVPESGERRVLGKERFAAHLRRRKLQGIQLRPQLAEYRRYEQEGNTVVAGKVDILVATLVGQRLEFSASGEANAWLEGTDLSEEETAELVEAVLENAVRAAFEQVVSYLRSR